MAGRGSSGVAGAALMAIAALVLMIVTSYYAN